MNKDETILVRDILKAIQLIDNFVTNLNLIKFVEDEKTSSAVAFQVQIIGEAASKISSDFKANHPDIPWQDMTDTRHKIVHHYMDIDLETLWDIVIKDLPPLKIRLQSLVKKG